MHSESPFFLVHLPAFSFICHFIQIGLTFGTHQIIWMVGHKSRIETFNAFRRKWCASSSFSTMTVAFATSRGAFSLVQCSRRQLQKWKPKRKRNKWSHGASGNGWIDRNRENWNFVAKKQIAARFGSSSHFRCRLFRTTHVPLPHPFDRAYVIPMAHCLGCVAREEFHRTTIIKNKFFMQIW